MAINPMTTQPIKVISGGQTGADQGGLEAARLLGLPTGGWAPAGYRTEDGPQYSLQHLYGLVEMPRAGYLERTIANARMSDATIIFGVHSVGSRATEKACNGKPYIWVFSSQPWERHADNYLETVVLFLRQVHPSILNIAGNRESVSPGIYVWVRDFMAAALIEYLGL